MPFTFKDYECSVESGTLASGDYSVRGLESFVSVERKSLPDLIGCFTSGRERFSHELDRLRAYPSCAIVVESAFGELLSGNYRSRMPVKSACMTVFSIMQKHRIPFYFAKDRTDAEYFTFHFLRLAWKHGLETYQKLIQ